MVRLYLGSGCCEYNSSQQSLWTEKTLLIDSKLRIKTDLKNNITPVWHDETYLNKYVHTITKPKKVIPATQSIFKVSDKGPDVLLQNLSGAFMFEDVKNKNEAFFKILNSIPKNLNSKWGIDNLGNIFISDI